jgi:hypothetical protein
MVAPAAGDGEVQFVFAATLESPAIVLHRPLQHIEWVRGCGNVVDMG